MIRRIKSNSLNLITEKNKEEEIQNYKTLFRSERTKGINDLDNSKSINDEGNNDYEKYNKDLDEDISYGNNKTKEIEILLSDPDLMDIIDDKEINDNHNQGGTFKKLISKMGEGSLRRLILNLSTLNICVGSFNLPINMSYASIYIYPILIIIIGIISHWTLNIFSKIYYRYKKVVYEEIIKEFLFRPIIFIYYFLIVLKNFGNMVLEQIILYKLIYDIFIKLDIADENFFSRTKNKYFIIFGIAFFMLFPLFQIKTIDKINQNIIFKITILIIIILILLINYISLFIINFDFTSSVKEKFKINKEYFLFEKNELFNSLVVLFYLFSYHDNFLELFQILKIPSQRRVSKIINRAIIIDIIIYLIIAIIGYFSLPFDMIKELIIFRNVEYEENHIFNDWLMTFGRIFYLIYLIFDIFKNYNNLRIIILISICGFYREKISMNLIFSFCALLFASLIAVNFQYISEFICLIGALCSAYISFIIPLIIYIRENENSEFHWKNIFTFFLIIILFVISSSSLFFTIKKIIDY